MRRDTLLNSPDKVRQYLRLWLGHLEHEVFVALYLDAQNRLLTAEELFRGTLTQTSVYPREVVKHALKHNAAALILAHNHPSGVAEPSRADELLTASLKQALRAGRRAGARPPDRCRQRHRFVRRARTRVAPGRRRFGGPLDALGGQTRFRL